MTTIAARRRASLPCRNDHTNVKARNAFALSAVIEEFSYKSARALFYNYSEFQDRKPWQKPRLASSVSRFERRS